MITKNDMLFNVNIQEIRMDLIKIKEDLSDIISAYNLHEDWDDQRNSRAGATSWAKHFISWNKHDDLIDIISRLAYVKFILPPLEDYSLQEYPPNLMDRPDFLKDMVVAAKIRAQTLQLYSLLSDITGDIFNFIEAYNVAINTIIKDEINA